MLPLRYRSGKFPSIEYFDRKILGDKQLQQMWVFKSRSLDGEKLRTFGEIGSVLISGQCEVAELRGRSLQRFQVQIIPNRGFSGTTKHRADQAQCDGNSQHFHLNTHGSTNCERTNEITRDPT
jgi:hypothetical protein